MIDFGCGYGRVTRWLPTVLSPEKVTACDVQRRRGAMVRRGVRGGPLVAESNIVDTRYGTYDVVI